MLVRADPLDGVEIKGTEPRTPMCADCDEYGDCLLPAELDAQLGEGPWDDPAVHEVLRSYRLQRPEIYGPTEPPPGPMRLPGEFEPSGALYLAYTAIDDYDGVFGELLQAATTHGPVRVLYLDGARKRLEARLWLHDLTWSDIERVHSAPFNSIWVRDFGPIAVHTPNGVAWVDTRYVGDCLLDDALPTRLAASHPGVRVYRTPLRLDGGNLVSDGQGTCFMATGAARRNGLDDEQFLDEMGRWFGCERLVILHPLTGNVIEHVDMFLHVADHDLILLGSYEPGEHPENERRLEANRAALAALHTPAGQPYRVLRVPMPPPLEATEDEPEPLLRSHLNLVVFNGGVAVPVYGDDPQREARVLAIIGQAYPGREIIPVDTSRLAGDLGALHCVTFTVPAPPQGD